MTVAAEPRAGIRVRLSCTGAPSTARVAATVHRLRRRCPTGHSTLEFELRSLHKFAATAEARAAVAAWIEDCNHVRRHSAPGMVSPVDYERALAGKDAA